MKPLISIIIPIYNAEATLMRCVDSVLVQSFRDFEIILINDGSRDGSGALCDRYKQMDSRIRVIHQENAGVSTARNAGLRLAEGKYITFLDSDDCIAPGHLAQYFEAAEKYDCDVVVGGFTIIDQNGSRMRQPPQIGCFGVEIWEEICRDHSIFGYLWNKLFRGELLRSNELLLNREMYSQEDLDFCLSAFGAAQKVVLISTDSYHYYYSSGKRVPPYWDFLANQMKMMRIGASLTDLSPESQHCIHKRILSLLYVALFEAAQRDDYHDLVVKISRVNGLVQLLQTIPAGGEHGFVARSFAAGKYQRIRLYFRIRNRIRDAVRLIKNRKP